MRLASREQCRAIDERSQKEYALSAEILMEAAGSRAALDIEQSFLPELRSGRGIAVVCGPGGNGGDGLVVARQLASAGLRAVTVILIAPEDKRGSVFRAQLERVRRQGIEIIDGESDPALVATALAKAALIVDAVLGIGGRGEVVGSYRAAIESINRARAPVVSLDLPSGLDVDTGLVLGCAVKAERTLSFGVAKRGFFMAEGPSCVGRLRVLSIGFPRVLVKEIANDCFLFTDRHARKILPKRAARSHKSNHGHALILAGSPGLLGAGVLAATSAYRVGAGYATLASIGAEQGSAIAGLAPEVLTASATDEKLWRKSWSAIAVGPGLGTGDETETILKKLISAKATRVVVDADAITVAARARLFPLPPTWVLTPHAGELARILNSKSSEGAEVEEIEADRFKALERATSIAGCIVLFKGFRTLVGDGAKTWIIHSGNSALAKAGTGDVLTGMIAGLIAQGLEPMRATLAAAYLHGRVADEWVGAAKSRSSLVASDLGEILPGLMARLAGLGSVGY